MGLDEATADMQAYDTLSTSVKKSLYDQCGSCPLAFLRACSISLSLIC